MVRLKEILQLAQTGGQQYFNSTMVRLKVWKRSKPQSSFDYFNSTMVRLKDNYPRSNPGGVKFQFHYGTIKRAALSQKEQTDIYFNSTMVRLKDDELYQEIRELINFNSTMVRLKGYVGAI